MDRVPRPPRRPRPSGLSHSARLGRLGRALGGSRRRNKQRGARKPRRVESTRSPALNALAKRLRANHVELERLQRGVDRKIRAAIQSLERSRSKARPKATSRLLRIGVVQMTSSSNVDENLAFARSMCAEAEAAGVRLLCFPECFAFLGLSLSESRAAAQPLSGTLLDEYRTLAAKHKMFLSLGGFQEQISKRPGAAPPTHFHNTHVLVDDNGRVLAAYRKAHLFDVDVPGGKSFRESEFTRPGSELVTCDVDGVRVGLSVCYDLRFPGFYAALRDAGAQVLLVPSAFTVRTGLAHWDVLLRARAIENQCYVVAAAQVGTHNAVRSARAGRQPRQTFGSSCVVDPWGKVVARASDEPGLVTATLDMAYVASIRASMPVQTHKRYDLYESGRVRKGPRARGAPSVVI